RQVDVGDSELLLPDAVRRRLGGSRAGLCRFIGVELPVAVEDRRSNVSDNDRYQGGGEQQDDDASCVAAQHRVQGGGHPLSISQNPFPLSSPLWYGTHGDCHCGHEVSLVFVFGGGVVVPAEMMKINLELYIVDFLMVGGGYHRLVVKLWASDPRPHRPGGKMRRPHRRRAPQPHRT